MKREDVVRILKAHQSELRKQYGVKSLALFGSVAREEAQPDSDVDLLVEFDRPVGLFAFIGLQQYLEAQLGRKVDLGTLRSLKPRLKASVLQEAIRVA
jgi:predicted nucleotidyltransferase